MSYKWKWKAGFSCVGTPRILDIKVGFGGFNFS